MFFLTRRSVAVASLALAIACLPGMSRISNAKAEEGLKVGSLRVSKVLFLGNSITFHGPAPAIGWNGSWGMAATTRDKDYVHQLLERISKTAGGTPKSMIRNIADFERKLLGFNIGEGLKEELAFEADVVVLAIGENAASPKTDEARKQLADALKDLLAQLGQHGHPKVFVRSSFWPDVEKDQILKKAADDAGAVFVDITKLGGDPTNAARSERQIEHAGVGGHPGDKGMAAIADAIWAAMKQAGSTAK